MPQSINSIPNNLLETHIRTTWDHMWSGDPPMITKIDFTGDTVLIKFGTQLRRVLGKQTIDGLIRSTALPE